MKKTNFDHLLKVEDGKAEIDVKGTIPSKSDKQSKDGMTHTMSMGGSESGKIIVDENTGWLLNQNRFIKPIRKKVYPTVSKPKV